MEQQHFEVVGHCGPAKFFKSATVTATRYPADNTICLVANVGTEDQQVYTVCLAHDPAPTGKGIVWLKDWSENKGVPEALVEAGLVELTGAHWPTGHVYAKEAKLLPEITI